MVRSTIAIGLSLAGVACGLTLVNLSMRAVMDVGGFRAEGGRRLGLAHLRACRLEPHRGFDDGRT
ncbi:MAG: hypothetical protein ACRDNP_10380 [Gaiellaceae bacterium]